MANIIMKKKINWRSFKLALLYNGFTSCVLGLIPVLIFYYTMPLSEFTKALYGFVPNDKIFIYLVCIAGVGIFFRIHQRFVLKNKPNDERNKKIQDFPNRMIQPLVCVYNVFSGLLIGIGFIGFINKEIFMPAIFFVIGIGLLLGIAYVDSEFISTERT